MEKIQNQNVNVKPLWILCNPRSGSSFLCDLLNNTDRFPKLNHARLKNFRGPLERGLSFNEWLRLFAPPHGPKDFEKQPIPHIKCIYHQWRDWFGDRSSSYVEKYLSRVKFVWLHRKDVYAQAASLYFAKTMLKKTKKILDLSSSYHIYNKKDLQRYMNMKITFDDKMMTEAYREALSYEDNWASFLEGKKCLKVFYEDLLADPSKVICEIMKYVAIPYNYSEAKKCVLKTESAPRQLKMTRPEQKLFITHLKNKLL